MITIDNLVNSNNKAINEDFVKKMILEFQGMVSQLNRNSDVEHLRNIFKQFLNTSKESLSSSEDFEIVSDFVNRASNHFQSINTMKPITTTGENGNVVYANPISNNQLGWYTFQSSQLTNNGGYGKNEISHRFYINANAKVVAEFSEKLIKEFEKRKLPFYFKINTTYTQGPKDFIVIYSSSKELENTIDILNSIAIQNPELISQINKPHDFTNNIDNWIGYAQENKQLQGKESFTGLMSDTISQVLVQSVRDWVNAHPNMSVRSDGINPIFAKDLVNDSMLDDTGKDYYGAKQDKVSYYQGISYLLSAIQRVDYDFVNSIVGKLRNKLQELNIDPNNICLNKDVMKELQTIINIDSREISNQNLSGNDSLQALREEYQKMMEGPSDYNIGTSEHHGIHR
jgi:hypothetical protein